MKTPIVLVNRRNVLVGAASLGVLGTLNRSFLVHAAESTAANPIANTEYGSVRGVAANKVISFRGVPYGGSTEGVKRFQPPSPPKVWKDVRDAIQAGPRAPQSGSRETGDASIFRAPIIGEYFSGGRKDAGPITDESMSENCLVLNVLTPALTGKRAVMVYIHGGGFNIGTGALTLLGDRFVAEENVVLVGVNHRLNAFGYTYLAGLSSDGRYADSGNVGQLDLVAALTWVKNNIANFGGDPSNVTIFGESGGGAKVSTLLAMPSAKGLFRRAIIESGSSLSVRTKEAATESAKNLLRELQLTPAQLDQLDAVPMAKMLAAGQKSGPRAFGPVVDGRSVPHQTWKPTAPPEAAGVSLIIGNCKDESTLFALSDQALFSLDWVGLKEREIKAGIPADKVDALIAMYRKNHPNETASDLYFRISSDRGARRNALAQARAKLDQKSGDVYMYHFAWNTGLEQGKLRAFHTAELPLAMRLVANPAAENLSRQIAGAWAAFARTGNPNHKGLPKWDAYTPEGGATMSFDAGKTVSVSHPARDELALLAPYSSDLL